MSRLPSPPTSFSSNRRYSQCKHLTIYPPSYNNNDTLIHSAPLRIPPRTKNNKVTKKSPPTAKFPSPPIVPSQQPSWKQYRQSSPSENYTTLSQKQKFLQPFEHLYDHIEQARKTTEDDLLERIQECVARIEKLEYKVAKDIPITPSSTPPPVSSDMKSVFIHLLNRIDQLESKLIK